MRRIEIKALRLAELRVASRIPRTWSKTLETLSNPLESLRVRLQATLRSVVERASELWVLLVKYSKLRSAERPTNGSVASFEQTEH